MKKREIKLSEVNEKFKMSRTELAQVNGGTTSYFVNGQFSYAANSEGYVTSRMFRINEINNAKNENQSSASKSIDKALRLM
ncbi:MAG: hypothetical protein LBV72_10095 [Tannerella sp.]|jgi:hypothetical protein|nr:hypothetical protein [Tannerella sp.]